MYTFNFVSYAVQILPNQCTSAGLSSARSRNCMHTSRLYSPLMLYVYLRNWPSAQITGNAKQHKKKTIQVIHRSSGWVFRFARVRILTDQRVDVRTECTNIRPTRRQRNLAARPLAAKVARYARQRRQSHNTVARRRCVPRTGAVCSTSAVTAAIAAARRRLKAENVHSVMIGGDTDARRLAVKVDAVDGGLYRKRRERTG